VWLAGILFFWLAALHTEHKMYDLFAIAHGKRSSSRLQMFVFFSGFREWKKSAWKRLLQIILTKKRRRKRRSEAAAFRSVLVEGPSAFVFCLLLLLLAQAVLID